MIKRNIIIGVLISIVVAVFVIAIKVIIFPGDKEPENSEPLQDALNPIIKISDVIEEATYMGAYSAETEIYADEAFSAKEILKSAIAKQSGLPQSATIKINDINVDELSVFFDDGKTMRTLTSSGNTNVMIIAAVPVGTKNMHYAYNVEISVKESRTPKLTEAPSDGDSSALTLITTKPKVTTAKKWDYNNNYAAVTTTKKPVVTKITGITSGKTTNQTGAAVTTKPGSSSAAATEPAITEPEPTEPPATEPPVTQAPPAPTEPPAVDPPSVDPPVEDPPAVDPPVEEPPVEEPPAEEPPAAAEPPAEEPAA